jgi:hypothetical protein
MSRSNVDEICDLAEKEVKAFSDRPGQGLLLFAKAERENHLRKLAVALAKKLSEKEPLPIYVVQGGMVGEHSWPFSRIKKGERLRLGTNGTIVTETETGLIFPQDRPIVLLVEYFDRLEFRDQRAYSHLVDGEGGEFALHAGSILIAGLISTSQGKLEPGALDRGMHCILDMKTE